MAEKRQAAVMEFSSIDEIVFFVDKTEGAAFFFTPPAQGSSAESFLFVPDGTDFTCDIDDSDGLASALDRCSARSGWCFVTYEAGASFQKIPFNDPVLPLGRFRCGGSAQMLTFSSRSITEGFMHSSSASVCDELSPDISREDYIRTVSSIRELIGQGETYQINFTMRNSFSFTGSAADIFLRLLFFQSAPYSAFIHDGSRRIVSLSPEIFFEKEGDEVRCRPMKGTAKRGRFEAEDAAICEALTACSKERAENVMIVDLIRNDLHAVDDSITAHTTDLFSAERYETVFQMTSSVSCRVPPSLRLSQIFLPLFPCGSITGAPKLRSMEIIAEKEQSPRGIYTGAIGLFTEKKSAFSVPIRTLVLNTETGRGELGLGSGIVWDSNPENEYDECLRKGFFFTSKEEPFCLLETMRAENGSIKNTAAHMKRLRSSADFFLFLFDEKKIAESLDSHLKTIPSDEPFRIRLELHKWGALLITSEKAPADIQSARTVLSSMILDSGSPFRFHKTSRRKDLDDARAEAAQEGFFETIFTNERGEICEGSFTNLFLKIDDRWKTPQLESGLLPGVERERFIAEYDVEETVLFPCDLEKADEMILTNSLRGEIRVESVTLPCGRSIRFHLK